jgi:glycosyltransferase involved in cell wall biosynthesis
MNQKTNYLDILKTKTFAIVSSYSDNCGNASYTKQLIECLKPYFKQVDCIDVKQSLIHYRNTSKQTKKNILNAVKKYDVVNIQYELGLFDHNLLKAAMFVNKIIDTNKNVFFTIHSLHLPNKLPNTFFNTSTNLLYQQYKRFKKKLSKHNIIEYSHCMFLSKIKALRRKKYKLPLIVHTEYMSEILLLHKITNYHHPIVNVTNEDIKKFYNQKTKEVVFKKYGLNKNNIYLGVFGFYGAYKGFEIAIKALSELPKEYHLIIAAQRHPSQNSEKVKFIETKTKDDIDHEVKLDINVSNIIKLIEKYKVSNRIRFINHLLNENDFKEIIAATDIPLFLYHEVGQGGSGPIAYALYLNYNGKIIITRTKAFEEYNKYYPDCFTFIDQGNYIELIDKLFHIASKRKKIQKAVKKYNMDSNINLYLKCSFECLK